MTLRQSLEKRLRILYDNRTRSGSQVGMAVGGRKPPLLGAGRAVCPAGLGNGTETDAATFSV